MCGLAGFVATRREEESLEAMLDIQAHRGPDDRGRVIVPSGGTLVHLGHNRLAVIDPRPRSRQPFVSPCGNYHLIFNGEIYNYRELRLELEKLGHRFETEGDTEVLLHAWMEWGSDTPKRLIGMFAFALLDRDNRKIWLVRDRVGVKPLHYYLREGVFLFASEIKAFHRHPSFWKILEEGVLPDYFRFGYIPAPRTIYRDTYRLEPGTMLAYELSGGKITTRRYWSISQQRERLSERQQNEAQTLDALEELLYDAAEKRMIADVPAGVFLSGGIDSSLVTALLARRGGYRLRTFTVGFREAGYNEAREAATVARHLGTEHHELILNPADLIERIEELPFVYDEPFGDSSALATMALAEFARKEVTVALSADGGDEIFGGYSKYHFLERLQRLPIRSLRILLRLLDESSVTWLNDRLPSRMHQSNIRDKFHKYRRALEEKGPTGYFYRASSYAEPEKAGLFLRPLGTAEEGKRFTMDEKLPYLEEMMRVDFETFLPDDVLTKVDRSTMYMGLEAREPLLDHRLAEFMASVPLRWKRRKYLAKKLLYRHLPRKVVERPKRGFQVPLEHWLRGELKPLVEHYLQPKDDPILDPRAVDRIKASVYSGRDEHLSLLWFLLIYRIWQERWLS